MTIFTSPICESLPTYKLIYLERSRKTPPRYSLFLSVSATCVPRWRAIDPGPEFCTHCSKKLPRWEFFAGTASGREKSLLRPSALGRALGTPVSQNCFSPHLSPFRANPPHKGGWRTYCAILLPAFADKYRFSLFQLNYINS